MSRLPSLLLACLLAMLSALALGPAPAAAQAVRNVQPLEFRDRAEEQRFHDLTVQLRCVMCQNQSLADSDAPIAHDLRHEVFQLMRAGRSDAEIKTFLVDRYGEFVLYKPEVAPGTWLLWFGPLLLVLAGGVVVWRILRRGNADRGAVGNDDNQEW